MLIKWYGGEVRPKILISFAIRVIVQNLPGHETCARPLHASYGAKLLLLLAHWHLFFAIYLFVALEGLSRIQSIAVVCRLTDANVCIRGRLRAASRPELWDVCFRSARKGASLRS